MKIKKKEIKIFLFSFLGFCILGFIILYTQNRKFDNLLESGRYTVGVGEKIEKRRTGWEFKYSYEVNNMEYEGSVVLSMGESGMTVGGIYFVVFDPKNPDKKMLIQYPSVPAEINLESTPAEGWSELPVQTDKDSIIRF